MNYIIKQVIEYQSSKSNLVFEELVNEMSAMIKVYANKIPKYYRDDFSQELLECLLNVLNKFSIKKVKSISVSLFDKDNSNNLNEILNDKYVSGFVNKYGTELLISAFKSDDKRIEFLIEFELFCNENQFIKYLTTSFDRKVKLYYRQLNKKGNFEYISLNLNITNEIELLDLISEETANDEIKNFYDESLLSNNNQEFLNLFKVGDRIITEKEVAKKLNITQQAVSSRLKRLKKRYIKEFNKKYKEVEM